MKKFKYKIFIIIFSILSIIALSSFVFSNVRNYYNQKRMINDILSRRMIDIIPPFYDNNQPKIFLNYDIYTIILDKNGEYSEVINHTDNTIDEENIKKLSIDIIKNHKTNKYIGNLYFDKYSYVFTKNNTLIIINNSNINQELIKSFITSFIIIIIFEIIIFLISYILTKWVSKPVLETFENQNRFIQDVSHELKTPLSVLIASVDAYYKDNDIKWISNIKNESERMSELVKNLLDLSQIENNKKMNFKEENISVLVETSILTSESLFYESKLKLKYNIEDNIKLVCNSIQIKQLVSILIDNAIKYSEEKGNVNILLKQDNKDIIFEIKNKGIAIKEEEREKIFERFYKSDESRNRDKNNYGLGLAIAKSIVENHNGKIEAYSKNGYTTFKVNFKRT